MKPLRTVRLPERTAGARSGRARRATFLLGLTTIVAAAPLAGCARSPAGRQSASGNLFLLHTRQGSGGGSLVSAPAVAPSQIDQRLADAAAATGGELEVTLAWNSLTDLDLEVRDPFGETITAHHPRSASGGVQDVDANPTLLTEEGHRRAEAGQAPGPETVLPVPEFFIDLDRKIGMTGGLPALGDTSSEGGKAPSRFTRAPVEHIYFARAPGGGYTVFARCYSWRESSSTPLPFTVEVRSRGKVFRQVSGTLGPASYVVNGIAPTPVCQFTMP